MSHEIVFTSAARGLRAGSTGFCTVRSTPGMPQNLASLLEQLTGYTHAYDAYDRSLFQRHPVNFAHYISQVGGQRFHVLARVSNAPLDHTNRSNKLAHLIAFDDGEIDLSNTQGPAAVIKQRIPREGLTSDPRDPEHWVTQWPSDREPCVLPDSKNYQLPSQRDVPLKCQTWKEVLDDAGWAAVLADSVNDRKRKTIPVVFSLEQKDQCLDLVNEALNLLPPDERWDVTFSTFYSGSLPTKIDCRWQFMLDSTALAQKALRNSHRNGVIDLTSLQGVAAPTNSLTPLTGTKERPWLGSSLKRSGTSTPPSPGFRPPGRSSEEVIEDLEPTDSEAAGSYRLRGPGRRTRPRAAGPPSVPDRRDWLPSVVMGTAALFVLTVGFFLWVLPALQKEPDDEYSKLVAENEKPVTDPDHQEKPAKRAASAPKKLSDNSENPASERKGTGERTDAGSSNVSVTTGTDAGGESDKSVKDRGIHEVNSATTGTKTAATKAKEKAKQNAPRPFDAIRNELGGKLSLPIPRSAADLKRQELVMVHARSPQDCQIRILGEEIILKSGNSFHIQVEDGSDSSRPYRKWSIYIDPGGIGSRSLIGSFMLEKRQFSFKWASRESLELAETELELTCKTDGNDSEVADRIVCSLREPEFHSPAPLPAGEARTIKLLDRSRFNRTDGFLLKCSLEGLKEHHKGPRKETLEIAQEGKPGKRQSPNQLVIKGEREIDGQPYKMLDLEITFVENKNGDLALQVAKFIHQPAWSDGEFHISREPFRRSDFKKLPDQAKKFDEATKKAEQRTTQAVKELKEKLEELQKDKKKNGVDIGLTKPQLKAAETAREKANEMRKFSQKSGRWYELVQEDLADLENGLKIHYELVRRSGNTEAAEVPIVATKDD